MKHWLTSEEKDFFYLVYQAVLTNPFSDERVTIDLNIAGMFPGAAREQLLDRTIAEVRDRVRRLDADGRGDLSGYAGKDRSILLAAFLFDIFHFLLDRFDTLIREQIAAGEKSVNVPFADEALGLFHQRGFSREEALHFFALCYQLRRAYYFIDRGLVGRSRCMKKMRESLWNNVFTCDLDLYNEHLWNRMEDFSTLILGETGTGKTAAAMAIGRSGFIPFERKTKCFAESFIRSFVALNLSQYPGNLIESELFGHRKGAFTGAVDDHKGVFDRCSPHGAIFLDEIGEVGNPVQVKLLKVLEERRFNPVGSHQEQRFVGRIIAATNRSAAEIREKSLLRDDFFYRLCSDIIMVPPLRERILEDPAELDDLLAFTVERITGHPSPDLEKLVKKAIRDQLGNGYAWPGNVRELGQCVRGILLKRSCASGFQTESSASRPTRLMEEMEAGAIDARNLIRAYCRLLHDKFGTYGEVARRTGLDRRTVRKHIESEE